MGSGDDRGRQGASTISVAGLPRRMGDRHCLVVWKDGAPARWPLPAEGQITIGRERPAEILIDSPT
ncbi:MAG TPA: hypothetical protein VK989_04520, partial [Polyangia bacterium]|nr:hypothetical protein [Polyangia bacterium]